MKTILMSFLASVVPPLVTQAWGNPDSEPTPQVQVVVRSGGDEEGGEPNRIVHWVEAGESDDGARHHGVFVVRAAADVSESGPNAMAEADPNRGWLGVSLMPVPEALAAQLNLSGGVLIQNVVKDSAADQAGLMAHDVLISIDGVFLEVGVRQAAQLIGDRAPGTTVNATVLRDGKEISVPVTLGSRADMPAVAWKFDMPVGELHERVKTRGMVIRRGPNNKVTVQKLGDVDALADLPEDVRVLVPRNGTRSVQVTVKDGVRSLSTTVERDGVTITVQREGEGPITVDRTDSSGAITSSTYASLDELRASDVEAADVFGGVDSAVVELNDDEAGDDLFTLNLDLDGLPEEFQNWHREMEEHLGQVGESYREALDRARVEIDRWRQEHGITGDGAPGDFGLPIHGFAWHAKPRQSFKVRTDGTIEVRTRHGDSEVVQLYTDEADLQRRAPELWEKFDDVMSAEEK